MKFSKWFWLILFITITACSKDSCEINEDLRNIPVNVQIDRLEDILFSLHTKEEIKNFLNQNKTLKVQFLASDQYPDDSILTDNLFERINNPYIDTLLNEAREEFGEMKDIKTELELALKHLKSYYSEARIPKVQTLVTGMGSSELYVSDSLIIIGLDYYIGPQATYRPIGYPNYILSRYQKEYIVPAIMLLLSHNYIKENYADRTMLADMVYYGKRYYFTKQMMPCIPDSLIMWYTGDQLKEVNENEDAVWAHFVANQLLFETNHLTKTKYMDERPTVYEIGDKCPGRIGSWLGWQIINSYMTKNPGISLQALMGNPNAKEIFDHSAYKPRR